MTQQTPVQPPETQPGKRLLHRRVRLIILAVSLVLIAGGYYAAHRFNVWYDTEQTYHFATVQPGVLYRDGNRGLREFQHALNFSKAKTVISLVDDHELNDPAKSQFLDEDIYCTGQLIQYIRIPVPLGGWPTSEDIRTFLSIVSKPENQPVLVHCAQGVRRTGMFVAAYQESVLHQSKSQATDQIKSFGHRARDTDDIRTFINEYDPATQTVPAKDRGKSAE